MKKTKIQSRNLTVSRSLIQSIVRLLCFFILFVALNLGVSYFIKFNSAQAQTVVKTLPQTPFRIGERLTYNFSFERFENVAYAETYVVSRGLLGEKDAVELRSKFKTSDLLSAAFYLIDETRTTYASAETGLPLYVRKVSNAGVLPKETINNYLLAPTTSHDLLTMIYQVRNAGGVGSFSVQENDRIYTFIFQPTGTEKIQTDAGNFETNLVSVQSDYFTERGVQTLRINFSVDERRLPVLLRFRTAKGEFRGALSSIQDLEPEAVTVAPTPTPIPRPTITPKPPATPAPYVENQPLLPELPFDLGEALEYQVTSGGQRIGLIILQAKERKQFSGEDSLLLTATATGIDPPNQLFVLNDNIQARVNPDSLAPQQIEFKFNGFFKPYNQTVIFDQRTGTAVFGGAKSVDIPVGTHSILSLAYAIRSFNLKPSKDPNNPVNDTRVAVFLGDQAYVFTLRPSNADIITLQNEKVSAQMISISTGNPQVDMLQPRIWLSNDEKRLPLRLVVGNYQADLISEKQIPPK